MFLIIPKKKDLSERDLLKIDLNRVFPCFHWNKSISPTHNPNITLIFELCNV